MPHVSPHLTPLGRGRTGGKLNQVERILNITVDFTNRHVAFGPIILELTGQTHAQHGQGFGAKVFAELEEFEESQPVTLKIIGKKAVREGIMPTVFIQWPVFNGTDGFLPIVPGFQVCTFHNAPTGETEDARLKIGQGLGQILAHAILTSLPRVDREQGNVF